MLDVDAIKNKIRVHVNEKNWSLLKNCYYGFVKKLFDK